MIYIFPYLQIDTNIDHMCQATMANIDKMAKMAALAYFFLVDISAYAKLGKNVDQKWKRNWKFASLQKLWPKQNWL